MYCIGVIILIDNHNDLYRTVLGIWLDMFCMYCMYFFCEFWFYEKHSELKLGGFND